MFLYPYVHTFINTNIHIHVAIIKKEVIKRRGSWGNMRVVGEGKYGAEIMQIAYSYMKFLKTEMKNHIKLRRSLNKI